MLISIIIPAYNAAKTINLTLKSALDQQSNLYNTEIIIVDDGSTDETLSILEAYKNVCKVITQSNSGVSSARQTGFLVSQGDFIQYLDSDDLLIPGKLVVQLSALIAHQADIAYGDFEEFSEQNDQITIGRLFKGEIKGDPKIEIFKTFWRPPAALLYSREIAKKINWSTTLPNIEDTRYLLDAVLLNGKLVYTPGIQAKYRTNQANSLSRRSKKDFLNGHLINIKEIYSLWKNDIEHEPEKKEALIESLRYTIHELSTVDQNLFQNAIDILLNISPRYIPEKSLGLRLMSHICGYRNAEKLAGLKRYFKAKHF